ncbi:MAG TPA: YciI-like protein [Mycobacteriales bacterium]|nr:YciI-like protein [Mycobacteriales bacterium]
MHFALLYTVVDDYLERRGEFREEHLSLARAAHARGELLLAGAFAEPADGVLLVFRVDSAAVVEDFVQQDPYVVNGLVVSYRIRPWTVVVGAGPDR